MDTKSFIELENQSVSKTLNTNDTLHYELKWILRQLPDWVNPAIGDQILIDFVNWAITGTNKPQKPETPINLESNINEKKIGIYPNPAYDKILLDIKPDRNYIGSVMFKKNIFNNHELDLSQLKSGFYFVKISDGNKQISIEKILKI